ncbi:MAG: ATP-binding protein [Pseudomonadota bacterium]
MFQSWSEMLERSHYFMPHGHCYLWLPSLLWLHVVSDLLIGTAYLGISVILYLLVRTIRLPFSPLFVAFGLFIGLCGLTHFMNIWVVWHPDYVLDGFIKAATATASVATAIGLFYAKPQVVALAHTARLSEERRVALEQTHAALETAYDKIKQLDELKSQFFANVSHELRTPLTLILGPTEQLLSGAEALTPQQQRQLQSVHRNGQILLRQVNELLDVAKLEVGQMQVHWVRLDVAGWLRAIGERFEVAAEQRRLRYTLELPASLMACADFDLLERVVVNLLANAFKLTPAGGAVRLILEEGGDEFRVHVEDTGPGIEPSQHEVIFERFRQAADAATRPHGGTGLGLAIAKDLVELHGGRIGVASKPGEGARFTVHLPVAAPVGVAVGVASGAPDSAAPSVALEGALHALALHAPGRSVAGTASAWPSVPDTERPSVLLVEDNHDMREFVAHTLSTECQVTTAVDGQDGMALALQQAPDLIITDVMMPRMSGEQLVRAVRARRELDPVPILLLTAKTDDALKVQLLESGAQDYLAKPFLPQELQARAANLIAMKRAGDTLRQELSHASGDVESMAKMLAAKHHQLQGALDAMAVARDQAQQASLVKSEFLGLVSHELRTPLSTIQMNAQLMERDPVGGEQAAALKPRLSRLLRASHQMSTLIDGLLEYTRAESGRVRTHAVHFEPMALAQEVLDAQRDSVPAGVRLVLEPPQGGVPLLWSDPRLLRVVLDNLVSNALKFTRQGEVVVRLGVGADATHWFEVADTGIGMSEADLPRIFQPFEQLEPIRHKSVRGVGLGLALVKNLLDALGGRIAVRSALGEGSTFTLTVSPLPGADVAALQVLSELP